MKINILNAKSSDSNADDIPFEKKYDEIILGNINDSNETVKDKTKNNSEGIQETDGYFVSEETEDGLVIKYIDNGTNTLQNGLNNLHK